MPYNPEPFNRTRTSRSKDSAGGVSLTMKTETINFETKNGATTAFVAQPDTATTPAPAAVILIQEWWGINDHVRDLAGRYAKEGYICIAPDLFRGKLAKNTEEASRL